MNNRSRLPGRLAGPARTPGIAADAMLLAAAIPGAPARAQAPDARVGPFDLKPYLLLQQQEGGTFDQNRDGGQGTGADTRRARVGAEAKVAGQVEVEVVYDFGQPAGGSSRFFDAEATYTGLKPLIASAGIIKPAFTLEYAQSPADILFLERASIVGIVGGLVAGAGRTGAQLGASGVRWLATAFLTGGTNGPGAQSDQRALLGRLAGLAVRTPTVSLHLGASAAWLYRVPRAGDGQRTLSLSDQTELRIDNVDSSLSTGTLQATGAWLAGVEAGLAWRGLWMQAEGYGLHVDRGAAGPGVLFSGGYVQASWTVLGRPRQWKPAVAAWGRPSPAAAFDPLAGEWGAVELAARFSAVDLNDADVRGGRQSVWTAGVNWYPADFLRFTTQYQHAEVAATATPRLLDAVALQGQISF